MSTRSVASYLFPTVLRLARAVGGHRPGTALLVVLALGPSGAARAQQQPDPPCTVSILNQSAYVQADGRWFIPNVPTNMGDLRARLTCVSEGQTHSGTSSMLVVQPGQLNTVGAISLGQVSTPPDGIELTASQNKVEVTQQGETVDLRVDAVFPGGTRADVTEAARGTRYASTNPGVASVDADGHVTAHASGRVLITALHDAIVDTLVLSVRLSGDGDGDGMPDDWELAHGLNPTDPVDAHEDADVDALSNLAEFNAGTDPRDPDTDDDTLLDGAEVVANAHGWTSEPTLFDTDGDLLSDGLENARGTNPRDPDDPGTYTGLLSSLNVEPSAFALTVNTAVPEPVTRQLTVTGTLVDGTIVDLTENRGTVYVTDNPGVATVDGTGRVSPGPSLPGVARITAENSSLSDTSDVAVAAFSPTLLSTIRFAGIGWGVFVSETKLYVAAGAGGLLVYDVANPAAPVLLGRSTDSLDARHVVEAGGVAYVADASNGVVVLDVTDPGNIALLARVPTTQALQVALSGTMLLVADGVGGLRVVDVTSASAPILQGSLSLPGLATAVGADGTDVAVGTLDLELGGLFTIDASQPASPRVLGRAGLRPSGGGAVSDVVLRDRRAFVADGRMSAGVLGGLRVVDLSNPQVPVLVGTTSDAMALTGVALDRWIALTSDYYFVNAVPMFDVSTSSPNLLGSIVLPGDVDALDIAVADGVLYESAIGQVQIVRYAAYDDDPGGFPRVSISSPSQGALVLERRTLPVTVAASDDSFVTKVEVTLDGAVVGTDYAAPYEFEVTAPSGPATLDLAAAATDIAGHRTVSDPVPMVVVADDDPVVELLSPRLAVPIVEGSVVPVVAAASDDLAITSVELLVGGVPVGSFTAPPYAVDYPVPAGATQLVVEAVAHDGIGQEARTGPLVFPVRADGPPGVVILEPPDQLQVTSGATIPVRVAATDDLGVAAVELRVNGTLVATMTTPPYDTSFVVPPGASSVVVQATALDEQGQSTSASVTLQVASADPMTTVIGRVTDSAGVGASGVDVQVVFSLPGPEQPAAVTAADGSFSMAGVPTLRGHIAVRAERHTGNVIELGRSADFLPVQGGTTDVGEIRLRSGGFPLFPASRPQTRKYMYWPASGDFDNDGFEDLLYASASNGAISVLLNDGSGNFGSELALSAGSYVYWAGVGDFDNDGNLDIVAAPDDLMLFKGKGDGRFEPGVAVLPSVFCYHGAVADLDGDGNLDLALVTGSVVVALGDGQGGFSAPVTYPLGSPYCGWEVAVDDFDGDALPDMAVTCGAIYVFRNQPSAPGTFAAPSVLPASGNPSVIAATRLNTGGNVDLVFANWNTNDVSVMRGNGNGTFGAEQRYPGGERAEGLATGDFDADGNVDVLVSVIASRRAADVLRGRGDGTLDVPRPLHGVSLAYGLLAKDLNRDGRVDVAAAQDREEPYDRSLAGIHRAPGLQLFPIQNLPEAGGGLGAETLAAGDLNGDGFEDIVVAADEGITYVLLGRATGTFASATSFSTPAGPYDIELADVDRDGKLDLVAVETADTVGVYRGLGNGTFAGAVRYAVAQDISALAVGDLTGDGAPEVAIARWSSTLSVLVNDGTGAFPTRNDVSGSVASESIAFGDVDQDADLDVVVAGYRLYNEGVVVFVNDGSGALSSLPRITRSSDTLDLADLDGDGRIDMVLSDDDGVFVLPGTGGAAFGAPVLYSAPGYAGKTEVADFDADGRPDIARADWFLGNLLFLRNRGAFAFELEVYAGTDGAYWVEAIDVAGDGYPDLAQLTAANVSVPGYFGLHPNTGPATACGVGPNPRTDVVGRVVDGSGTPLAGIPVEVDGGAAATISGADGRFRLEDVPMACPTGRVRAVARFAQGGATRFGRSAWKLPVAGSETDVGDVAPSTIDLYAGGRFERVEVTPTVYRKLARVVVDDGIVEPLGPSTATSETLYGVAFDGTGTLWGALEGGAGRQLVTLDAETGAVLSTIGSITDAQGGAALLVEDMDFHPASGVLYSAVTEYDGVAGHYQSTLVTIDLTTAVATRIGTAVPVTTGKGVAFVGNVLYQAARSLPGGQSVLLRRDTATGEVLGTVAAPLAPTSLAADGLGGLYCSGNDGVFLVDTITGSARPLAVDEDDSIRSLAGRP